MNTDMVHVGYRGSPPALVDVMGGTVSFMFDGPATSIPLIKGYSDARDCAVNYAKCQRALLRAYKIESCKFDYDFQKVPGWIVTVSGECKLFGKWQPCTDTIKWCYHPWDGIYSFP